MNFANARNCSRALLIAAGLVIFSPSTRAQQWGESFDDYGSFSTDPTDLDNEVAEMMGRYFQTNFGLGTMIFQGGLGKAYSAGILAQLKFIYYFDKVWGAELGIGFGRTTAFYDSQNTNTSGVDVQLGVTLYPVQFGLRYGFDQERLSRGLATMNPYLSVNGEFLFRNEAVEGASTVTGLDPELQPKFAQGSIISSSGFGVNVGGGMEFDVYRKRVFLGVDVRYHLMFWSDAATVIGGSGAINTDQASGLARSGNLITITGSVTYSY
jgi:hypothetical protein